MWKTVDRRNFLRNSPGPFVTIHSRFCAIHFNKELIQRASSDGRPGWVGLYFDDDPIPRMGFLFSKERASNNQYRVSKRQVAITCIQAFRKYEMLRKLGTKCRYKFKAEYDSKQGLWFVSLTDQDLAKAEVKESLGALIAHGRQEEVDNGALTSGTEHLPDVGEEEVPDGT